MATPTHTDNHTHNISFNTIAKKVAETVETFELKVSLATKFNLIRNNTCMPRSYAD